MTSRNVEKHETYTAEDPVYGKTSEHSTETGAKAEGLMHDVKQMIPGTQEHREMKPQSYEHERTGYEHERTGGMHSTGMGGAAVSPGTGEVHPHSTQTGAGIHQAWEDTKAHIPGTRNYEERKFEERR